jgi:uncharacterized protein
MFVAQASPETKILHDQIAEALLTESPDPGDLSALIVRAGRVDQTRAKQILYQFVKEINASLFPPVTKMELIHTEGCNLACQYCFEKDMLGYRRMPYEVGRRGVDLLFDYARGSRQVTITHFGGEPMVNFDAVRAITEYAEEKAAAEGKDVTFSMTSNGTLIDAEKAEYMTAHRIMVLLSLDGLKTSHDKYRVDKRGRGTFDQAMRGFNALKRTQGWIGVKMTIMPDNAKYLYRDVLGLYALGVNQFVVGYATGVAWPEEEMNIYAEQWGRLYQWYRETPRDDLRITDFDDFDQNESKPTFVCQAGNDSITVAVNGEISPCSKVLALDNRRLMMKLGDVQSGLTHVRNRIDLTTGAKLIAQCDTAGITESYQGGCWATNFSDNHDVFAPSGQDQRFKSLQRGACAGCGACQQGR